MTVSTLINTSGPFAADSGPFTYSFKITDAEDMVVRHLNVDTEVITILDSGDYTVDGVGDDNGGTVTVTNTNYTNEGNTITLTRSIIPTQDTVFAGQSSFNPQIHEDALDKLTMLYQEYREKVGQAIKVPLVDGLTEEELQLPAAASRADGFLAFDEAGLPFIASAVVLPSETASAWVTANILPLADGNALASLLNLGTAAYLNAGTGDGDLVQLDGTGLPAVDGSQLQNLPIPTSLPAGVIMPYVGSTAPSGYLLCDGSAVGQFLYFNLFLVIGLSYGDPGGGNFNLPDLRGRVPVGLDDMGTAAGDAGNLTGHTFTTGDRTSRGSTGGVADHQLTEAEIPGHVHDASTATISTSGSFTSTADDGTAGIKTTNTAGTPTADTLITGSISGNTDSTGDDGTHTNMPPFQLVNWIIYTAEN